MISVCIPVYNFNVVALVKSLQSQFEKSNISYEILILDDASKPEFQLLNREVKAIANSYIELEKNVGRSAIRNMFLSFAKFEWLLFLDCDSKIISDNFIENYKYHISDNTVIYGGRIYQTIPPNNPELILHWRYGRKVESKKVEVRKKHPYQSFHSNNFLVPYAVLQSNLFDESLTQYGHEDSLWALQLEQKNITIIHIDNPVLHDDLQKSDDFLTKARLAIQNLILLENKGYHLEQGVQNFYQKLTMIKLKDVFYFVIRASEIMSEKNLKSKHPYIFHLQLYKLGHYIKLKEK
ncbi:MAG: glycosyltransferase [Bacteroidota bacterium]|nr:glycosyltransferase [Bacteroidota bacterium]